MDSAITELYQALIIDHGRKPRNFGVLENATAEQVGFNPLCGDKLVVFVREEEGRVADIQFKGEGCAISMASASMMTQMLKGKTVDEAKTLFQQFHALLQGDTEGVDEDSLGKLMALSGVSAFPARVKCATLAWHTCMGALEHQDGEVTTE